MTVTASQYLTPVSKPQSSELIIYPYQGVGQIRFGMTREEVRSNYFCRNTSFILHDLEG